MEFNELIKLWRKEANLTLDEVAEKLHITPQALSFYENGKRALTIEMFEKIATVLERGVEVSFRHKGSVPLTKRQRQLIADVFYEDLDPKETLEIYKKMFDITEEELSREKLFDDMDEMEFINYGKVGRTLVPENDDLMPIYYHQEQYMMYLICNGCEAKYDIYGNIKHVLVPEDMPPYVPPKRTSKDGFIYEQRKLLLPILKKTFEWKKGTLTMCHYYFKRALGL